MTHPPEHFIYRGRDGCALHAASLGDGPPVVLLHGGGPDHHSLLPLGRSLADRYTVVLPDVRGYGRSVCTDPGRHTWNNYADDVTALLDHLEVETTVLGGTGLGSSITLRTCLRHPARVRAAVLISVEDIEDDRAKAAEVDFLDAFAARVRTHGIQAAWSPILPTLAPVISNLVADAIPRSNPDSIAAAAAIGHDRLLRSITELADMTTPTLVIPGIDQRHPTAIAEAVAATLPHGRLATTAISDDLRTAEDLATAFEPPISAFLAGFQ
ncbi:alpha/beta fold hydrolase [Saccharothrix texasensis]|uniref:Pimeloyl-ACP methyl ester carboxylesterase n=1 Tax=Saccharothrix texasensis TaxID=103734 RepID=A0A3N1H4X6_9PSEU|nr:alpha/beta hydrolase [Saccharothrix texasensis]ROP37272.1 pimeloyl-ACP methyl ester carboxylesterase [Saccharothrix texasensis]